MFRVLFASILLGALNCASVFSQADSASVRVLIIDGRNNHDWKATTTSLRHTLLYTGRFHVDVSTAPPPYKTRKPFPQRPHKGNDEQTKAWQEAVKAWRVEEKNYEAALKPQWDAWRPAFSNYDVVVDNYAGPRWPEPVQKSFIEYVKDGGGLVVIHAANNAFADWDEFNKMLGLGWRKAWQGVRLVIDPETGKYIRTEKDKGPHSGHGSKHAFDVVSRAVNHPIMRGIPPSWRHGEDELYHAMRGPAEGVTVLASAFSAKDKNGTGEHEPLVWTTNYGTPGGRIVTNSMGHYWYTGARGAKTRDAVHCVGSQTIFARSVEWAGSGGVSLDVPNSFPKGTDVSVLAPEEVRWTANGKALPDSPWSIDDPAKRAKAKKAINPYCMLSPEESLTTIDVADGFKLQLVVGEPHIREPVLCAWDGNGRLYVAEMRSYMQDEYGTGTKTLRNGRVSRHENTDGDGVMDKHTVFIDRLNLPRMILPLDDWIAVRETDSTDIFAYRDTDGDGVADEKKQLHKGPRKIDPSRSVEHQNAGLMWSIDNWIYMSRGEERYRYTDGKWIAERVEGDWNQWGIDQERRSKRVRESKQTRPLVHG